MKDDMKNKEHYQQIKLMLTAMQEVNRQYGKSIAFDKDNDELIFFDTNEYLKNGRMTGFKIKLENLV